MTIRIECVLQCENHLGERKMGIKSFHHTAISVTDLDRLIRSNSSGIRDRIEPPVALTAMPACRNTTSACRQGQIPPKMGLRAAIIMNVEASVEDLGEVIKGHPTLSEVVMEAALDW